MHKIGEWHGNDVGCFEVLRVDGGPSPSGPVPVFTVHRVTREMGELLCRQLSDVMKSPVLYAVQAHEKPCQCLGGMVLEQSMLWPMASVAYYADKVEASKHPAIVRPNGSNLRS